MCVASRIPAMRKLHGGYVGFPPSSIRDLDALCDDSSCDAPSASGGGGGGGGGAGRAGRAEGGALDADAEPRMVMCPTLCSRYPYACDEPEEWRRVLDDLRSGRGAPSRSMPSPGVAPFRKALMRLREGMASTGVLRLGGRTAA